MTGERPQRRLAAILAADVAGYSRLMGVDEEGTIARLKSHLRDVLDPTIGEHRGRIVKTTGDGLLAEFASVIDALRCAVEIQRSMSVRNASTPTSERIDFRLGLNVGDIIFDAGDIFGDGVNVAARLEALADPGGICVSDRVQEDVSGKIDLVFENIGKQQLKNIARPVRAYRVRLEGVHKTPGPAVTELGRPSIAILPFTNMSGDPDQEYFSDGITEDIITELSRFRDVAVVARDSTFAVKGKSLNAQEMARDLNATYLVSGSVRKSPPRIRITVQLIDAAAGNQLWAERYDEDMQAIFTVQDDMVAKIVTRVAGRVATAGMQKARRKRTENLAAYEYILRGQEHWQNEEIDLAHDYFRKAAAADPEYALAHMRIAFANLHKYFPAADSGNATAEELLLKGLEAARRAVALDGSDPDCHRALAQIHLYRKSFEEAAMAFEQLTATPSYVDWWRAACHAQLGEFNQMHALAAQALKKAPNFSLNWYAKSEPYQLKPSLDHLVDGMRKAGAPE